MKNYIIIISLITFNFLYSQKINKNIDADEIIMNVIKNKSKNSSKLRFKSFEYNNYSKIIFSANDSLIPNKIDVITDYRLKSFLKTRYDSTSYKFKQEIKNKHFFIAEKISKNQFSDRKEKETILAVKMAGFNEPVYEFITLGLSKINYYKNKINLIGTNYVSPLAKDAHKNYKYTLKYFNENNYVIHFKSKRRKKSVGLEGDLFIEKNSFSLTKVTTNIKGKINIKITQDFKYLKNFKHWFVDKTNILLTKGNSKTNIKAFRVLIGFRPKYSVSKFNPEKVSYIQITSKNDSIIINKSINIKRNDYAILIDKSAIKRNSPIWKNYNLKNKKKDKKTYSFLDSVVKERNIENKLIILRKITQGKFGTKIFDIDLSQAITFNNHEGFRFGLGGSTNDFLSSKFKLSGYAAYGNKDHVIKYKYGFDILLKKESNAWIGGSYTDDIFESAKPRLLFKEPNFSLINPRNTNISLFYKYKESEVHVNHDIAPNLITKSQISTGTYNNLFDYSFISRTKLLHQYKLTNLTFALEWTPLSKYMETPRGKFSVKKEYPKINAEITKSFDNILNGEFSYTQINLKLDHEIKTIKSGSTQFLLKAGYTFGEAPFSHLYNHLPNNTLAQPWRARINLSGTNAFETMLFNEFISDKYASIQIRQNFEKFRIGKKFKPKLSFITRYVIGTIKNPINHQGVKFKTLKKGYIESGLVLNQLLYGIGVSSFYRYGIYRFDKFEDNITLKITYVIDLF